MPPFGYGEGFEEMLRRIERAVSEHVGDVPLSRISSVVRQLSDVFTQKRADAPQTYTEDPQFRRAYIAHFLLINAAKILACLGEVSSLGRLPAEKTLHMLDLGCGPGTASLAAAAFYEARRPGTKLDILGIDRSGAMVREAKGLFNRLGSGSNFRGHAGEIDTRLFDGPLSKRRFDIIVVANAINEMSDERDVFSVCHTLMTAHLARGGILIVIEPALKNTARAMMRLRDELLSDDTAIMSCAPCLHRNPCPMLSENQRDWCHFYIEWERPNLIAQLDRLTGLDHRLLKMAYVAFGKRGKEDQALATDPLHRVVSSPLVSKGKRELILCGADGIVRRVMRQDKHRSEHNSDFERAKRGDIVQCSTRNLRGQDRFSVWEKNSFQTNGTK